jgi:hypothetical protein
LLVLRFTGFDPRDIPTRRFGSVTDEFKKFALRGNVVDLAVGVIIGAAFGAIVASLVGDVPYGRLRTAQVRGLWRDSPST